MNDREWWRGAVIYQIYPRSSPNSAESLKFLIDMGIPRYNTTYKYNLKGYPYEAWVTHQTGW